MSATAVTLGQDISQPKFNPWLIAVIVSLAAFMEVLDTSIAIHRWQPRSKQRRKRLRAHLISRFERHRIADQRLTRGNARAQAVLHGMSVYFHRKFVSVWHRAEPRGAATISGVAGHRRWRSSTHGTGDSSRYIPAPKRGLAFALYGITVVVAPTIGPTLGGWITFNYSWRWIFFINIPV